MSLIFSFLLIIIFQANIEIAKNWALAKVQETERASSVLLKDDLFQAFHADNPEISRDTLLSYFRRLMGCLNLLSHTKRGKILGYCHLSFKINETSELVVQKKEGTSKYKYVLDDEVPIERKKEMTKFKTANERKSCLGVADVLEYDESSEKGFIELKTKIQVTVNKLVPKHGGMVLKIQTF